jgi:DNA-binding beta-propeller fold protein YncE
MALTLRPALAVCLGAITLGAVVARQASARRPLAATAEPQAQKGGEDVTGPYDVAGNWPIPLGHAGYTWGSMGGIFAESPDRIYVLMRGELPVPEKAPPGYTGGYGAFGAPATTGKPRLQNCILIVDGAGKLVESWTQHDHLFQGGRGPHKIKINPYDPEKHVWIVDDERQQIFKITHDGQKLVMTLGEAGVAGSDEKHFGRPTDIAWLPDGTFFVTDGYVNTRVVKFDKDGKFLMTWGTKGTGPGQFNLPHAIDIDRQRRLYVADRSNSRIQIFDETGKYLDEWDHINQPYHLVVSPDQHVWVADGVTNKFLQYSAAGRLLSSWGTYGTFPGSFWGVHQFSVDSAGNLYIAETFGGRAQKFTPRKGVDPALLIPPMSNVHNVKSVK